MRNALFHISASRSRADRLRLRGFFFFLAALLVTPPAAGQPGSSAIPFGEGIAAKRFHASATDDENNVWFLTEAGVVSFNGTKWKLHNSNPEIVSQGLNSLAYDFTPNSPVLWLATSKGAKAAALPVDEQSNVTSFNPGNSMILSENILAVALGKKELRWFGTDKGISAFRGKAWLKNSYATNYPDGTFKDFPITAMATSPDGDSLYIATIGGGVLRVFRNEVDAVSGASEYAEWGPILMPSDNVYGIHVTADGTQWFGTDKGVARHKGFNTLEGWTVFTSKEGLADNFVQAINSDSKGNVYFGTRNGLSVYDGTKWVSYRMENGLASNNILTIATDKNDKIWLGTDNGVTSIENGRVVTYR